MQGGNQLSVADYTQRFLERTLENVLRAPEEQSEKQRTAEINFLSKLCRQAGELFRMVHELVHLALYWNIALRVGKSILHQQM